MAIREGDDDELTLMGERGVLSYGNGDTATGFIIQSSGDQWPPAFDLQGEVADLTLKLQRAEIEIDTHKQTVEYLTEEVGFLRGVITKVLRIQ